MNLTFKSVKSANFMQIGDVPVVVNLDNPGITAVVGANGSGKSSFTVEAISFCLFNKSFRGMTKAELVNTTNRKGTLVEVLFEKFDKQILVRRGIKPDLFEIIIDGILVEQPNAIVQQAYLETLLGFDFGTFIRTSMLGNANYMPFMTMKTKDRRAFVESILSLDSFTAMNKHVKNELAEVKKTLDATSSELAAKRAVLAEQTRINTKRASDTGSKLQEAKRALADDLHNIAELRNRHQVMEGQVRKDLVPKIEEKIAETMAAIIVAEREIAEMDVAIREANKMVKFFGETSTCPTCDTEMTEDHRSHKTFLQEEVIKESTAGKLSAGVRRADLQLKLTKLRDGLKKIENDEQKLNEIVREIRMLTERAKSRKEIIEGLKQQAEPEDTTPTTKAIEELTTRFVAIEQQIADYKIALELLDDGGVKATILQDAIPLLNQFVNECLEIMSIGIRLEFNEEFEETLVGRYADEFSYVSLSQGQRARLNLAVMFAWQQIQAIASGVQTNLLIIDEVGFADLDAQGVDAMFALLRKLWYNQTVFIISHNQQAQAQADRQIGVVVSGGFTKLTEST
jgi:DNA repair exonuclease SbcCD ATPase subunit